MQEKLENLYKQCVDELKNIGLDLSEENIGKIKIQLSKRNNKRYGCCKQEEPDNRFKITQQIGKRKIVKYEKFNKHTIEISNWVMELNDDIIKNTIMHELIHCFPFCNNHGKEFKMYAKYINEKLGYKIARLGNKQSDYEKSNIQYEEKKSKYVIACIDCGKKIYRNRLARNFFKKYRCLCGGKLILLQDEKKHN